MFPSHIPRVAGTAMVVALLAAATAAAPAMADSSAVAKSPTAQAPAAVAANAQSLASEISSALSSETPASTAGCVTPALTQPFLAAGDQNEYTLAPGESNDDFAGDGWTLGGGASIKSETLADGASGEVLDLPAGAYAISPPMCVDSDYPTARTMVQTSGKAQVRAGVFYPADRANQQMQLSGVMQGTGSGFTLSQPLQVHPGNLAGWQMVQFVFGTTGSGDGQIYNFYVDPRMCRSV